MRIVIGIDPSHASASTTHLLSRLAFPNAEAIFASVTPMPVVPAPGFANSADELIQSLLAERKNAACTAMHAAASELRHCMTSQEMVFELGEPTNRLSELADERHADLIAVGCRGESPLTAAFHGSVGRGLTLHSRHSLLISKGEITADGPLKAVFAYDGSLSCEEALDLFIEMRPQGITHVDVVIVDTPNPEGSPVTYLRGEGAWSLGPEHRYDLLMSLAMPAAERLQNAGYEARALCIPGEVPIVIEGALVDLHAELVILGAKGHGFIERIRFGSHALEQAVAEPHSVLILRTG